MSAALSPETYAANHWATGTATGPGLAIAAARRRLAACRNMGESLCLLLTWEANSIVDNCPSSIYDYAPMAALRRYFPHFAVRMLRRAVDLPAAERRMVEDHIAVNWPWFWACWA